MRIPVAVPASAFAVTDKIRDITATPLEKRDARSARLKESHLPQIDAKTRAFEVAAHDADTAVTSFLPEAMPAPTLSFDGLSNFDNIDLYELFIMPPDTIGDVGPDHYVQAVNSAIRVFDKNGNAVTRPFKFSELFEPLNTVCSTRNDGDPIVLYDPLADRWMISQFCTAFPPFRQLVAISRTGDPTGQYFVYEFVMPNNRINDYPKFGVWTDGYYMSTEEFFGSDYVGSGMFAFDRTKMLAGDRTARYIYFDLPFPFPARVGGLLPADIDGLQPPPSGTPNLFVGYSANEYGEAQDAIRLYDFHADFTTPANSTFSERPESPLPAAAFDPTSPFGRNDIRQPVPGESLDANSDRLMYRAAYRNFGAAESIVVNQTVRVSPASTQYRAGVRYYELGRTAGGQFSVQGQATIGDGTTSRWTGAAAQDHQGNVAVSYSFASDEKKPGIFYTGRLAGDPPGYFRTESAIVEGTGVQKAFGFRWGDYSGLSVDPADDCSFWTTNQYYTLASQEFSDFTWLTRIGRFRFPECVNAPRAFLSGTVTSSVTGQPIADGKINAAAYTRTTGQTGAYGQMMVLPGSYAVRVSATGYRDASATVVLSNGQSMVRDFQLEPIPVIEAGQTAFAAESCSINNAPEPGEQISITLPLRNTGLATAVALSARLLRSDGVIEPGPAQDYGTLPPGGNAVTRTFSFRVSPGVGCGQDIAAVFEITSAGSPIGTVRIPFKAGAVRYVLEERFDGVMPPTLPAGWSTSSTGAQSGWTTSTTRISSGPNSVFSPAPLQVGVNELVTPPISINSTIGRLTFRNWYDLETTFLRNRLYDGSVLEMSLEGGKWQDVIAAGGSWESGGYDGTIDGCCQNPLAGRLGWSGRSGVNQTSEYVTSSLRLPASIAGRIVRFRWRVGTDIGTFREGQYLDDIQISDGYDCSCAVPTSIRPPFDFDGDGKTDRSVYRPTDAVNSPDFIIQRSSDGRMTEHVWGSVGDLAASADFDGDRRADIAVFRPSNGTWYIFQSSNQTLAAAAFGLAGDRPLPADIDGDGKADIGVFRSSNSTWYSLKSSNGQLSAAIFGLAGDIPVRGDFDSDGLADLTVFRPSTGVWYTLRSSDQGFTILQFGLNGDRPVAGDFDGDGRTDHAVFRPSNGTWYLLRSKLGFGAVQFGMLGDVPLQADIDGDGSADIAVYRPATSVWYHIRSSGGGVEFWSFGSPGDVAVPSIYTNGQ